MARTKLNQRSANRVDVPMGATGGRTPPSKITMALFGTSIVAAIWALAMMTSFGRVAYVYFFAYSEYYMGVLSLVALSVTIMLGLVATDRLVLSIRQRVLLQSAHRTFGIIAVAALALHLWTKLMEGHIGVIDVFIPFLHVGNTLYIGLGTLSAWIMVTVMWTGIVRARFIGRGKPWMWRSIHAISYLMWPIALVHGLSAGRPAATWVIVSYVVCILGVLLGLAVRISVSLNRKKDFASQAGTGTGTIKPVGQLVPTSSPVMNKRGPSRRAEMESTGTRIGAERGSAPAAVLDRFEPVAPPPPPVSPTRAAMSGPPPISAPPYDDQEPRRGGRSRRRPEDDYADPRGRRYADEDEAPPARQRRPERAERYEPAEQYDEQTRAISRRAIESGRRRFDEVEEPPAPRSRRRVEEEQRFETQRYEPEPRPRSRRYAEEEPPAPRRPRAEIEAPHARRYAEEEEPAPRGRRYAEPEPEPAPRARRYAEEERYDDVPRQRGPRYPEDSPPPPASRGRRDRDNVDRADSGRHSRSEFVDLSAPPQGGTWREDSAYLEPDDTPTLVDMASRRARKATQQEAAPRGSSRGARRGRGRGDDDAADDDTYWRQLRGEAR
jgi:hypothetical protein